VRALGRGASHENAERFCYFSGVNWDDLRVLLAVVESSTLTEAAKSLGVTQTTVTRRLTALEEHLGMRLVSRTSHGVVVTEEGRTVAAAARDVHGRIAALDRTLLGRDDALGGRLRVTTVDMVGHYDAPMFQSFLQRYPEVELELFTGLDNRDLARDEADVAIRWTHHPPEPLVGRRIGRVPYALYGSRSLVEAVGVDAAPRAFPWLAWRKELAEAVITAGWMHEQTPTDRVVARYDTALSLHAGVRAGLGVAFLPCMYAERDLVCLQPHQRGFTYDVWLLVHPEAAAAARVRAFLDHAVGYYEGRLHASRVQVGEG
jgi:DNA-binding transcriptional LysR family regulator